jgi:glycosyltransferase involved in cell wall biosynthesis
MIYDFDDAIWLNDVSEANKAFSRIKNPEKISKTIEWSDVVFAGNEYLANYALQFSKNVVVIPTTVDTERYQSRIIKSTSSPVCIGWSGSITTIKHFDHAIPFLKALRKKYENNIRIKVIGDDTYRNDELNIRGVAWNRETEVEDLSEIDIGIMPLPDDPWTRGKCGLKGLTYMALEIPPIMSPVGVNKDIITDGVNGYLAEGLEEWVTKISALIESPDLRRRIGIEARKTVVEKYSVESQKENYLQWFRKLT